MSSACSRLFVFSHIVGWLAGTGCPGGMLVMGLSVRCHAPLWQCGIDEEQKQDDLSCWDTGTGRGDEKRKRKRTPVAGEDVR